MSLGPADVREVEFTLARRGYDEKQVDDFLDGVVAALEERDAALAAARQRTGSPAPGAVPGAAAGTAGTEPRDRHRRDAVDLLALAQRTAQEHVAEAEAAAAELLATAGREAEVVTAAAREEAERLHADATVQHREALDSLHRERHDLEQRLADLRRLLEKSRTELETYLGGLLAVVREPETGSPARPRALPAIPA